MSRKRGSVTQVGIGEHGRSACMDWRATICSSRLQLIPPERWKRPITRPRMLRIVDPPGLRSIAPSALTRNWRSRETARRGQSTITRRRFGWRSFAQEATLDRDLEQFDRAMLAFADLLAMDAVHAATLWPAWQEIPCPRRKRHRWRVQGRCPHLRPVVGCRLAAATTTR